MLRGAGEDPIKLTLAGQTADLLVGGTIGGDYRARATERPSRWARALGSATLTVGSSKASVSTADVGKVLAPMARPDCPARMTRLIVTLSGRTGWSSAKSDHFWGDRVHLPDPRRAAVLGVELHLIWAERGRQHQPPMGERRDQPGRGVEIDQRNRA